MSYGSLRHQGRLLIIGKAQNLFADISAHKCRNAIKENLVGSDEHFFLTPEFTGLDSHKHIYNMPFLLDSTGLPWSEANSYLCHLVENKQVINRPTDDIQRKASRLLDYKLFTEEQGFDWLDFSGRRLVSRPTYRYFIYLCETRALSPAVVNQYTSDVYSFYKFVSDNFHYIPMARVDSTKTVKLYFSSHNSTGSINIEKRSQTKSLPRKNPVAIGYVQDDGETLRPLTVEQINELKSIINGGSWSPIEKLIILISLMTGARKQTVLTLRLKNIKELASPAPDGTFKLHIGPGTLVDTKKSKKQVLYFPPQLVKELEVYANCIDSKERRKKFKAKYRNSYPYLPEINNDNIYLFLSDQGNCYYMGKDDPRYPIVKAVPTGQVVDQLKRKIFRSASDSFPRDFYYHWLRATHAYLLWLELQKHIDKKVISYSSAISFIQKRLNHEQRETTENYLKLFQNVDVQFDAQEAFEDLLLSDNLIEDV